MSWYTIQTWWFYLSLKNTQFTWSTISQCGFQYRQSISWSLFCSCDLSFIDLNEDVRSGECVCSVYSWWGLSAPPPLPTPHEPHMAEWQGSGWAKWWNDDPIMRSDSKMRGIRQRLHPPLTATPSSCATLPAAQMMIDLLEMDHRKHPLIFQRFIKNIYLQLYP